MPDIDFRGFVWYIDIFSGTTSPGNTPAFSNSMVAVGLPTADELAVDELLPFDLRLGIPGNVGDNWGEAGFDLSEELADDFNRCREPLETASIERVSGFGGWK